MNGSYITQSGDSVLVTVRVIPRANRSQIAGTRNDALLVRLSAPPVDGAANAALIEVLAAALDVPRRDISLIAGERSRTKRVQVRGLTAEDIKQRLTRHPG
ncbi:MAG TPA: DUF167 domain-containing protein [Vicinamibacterales bacterium]|nr:DUF167 domain-containing protein [Vicinamibacterales bacterium]